MKLFLKLLVRVGPAFGVIIGTLWGLDHGWEAGLRVGIVDGVLYGVGNIVATRKIPNGAVILILFAVIVFLVGLVSEQISSLRFEGRR